MVGFRCPGYDLSVPWGLRPPEDQLKFDEDQVPDCKAETASFIKVYPDVPKGALYVSLAYCSSRCVPLGMF